MVLGKLFNKKEKFFLELESTSVNSETAADAPVVPAPAEPVAVAPQPEPVAPTPAKEIPNITFAADGNVARIDTGRRLPGPSLDPFVQIANEVVRR